MPDNMKTWIFMLIAGTVGMLYATWKVFVVWISMLGASTLISTREDD
jgi:hypothetical protein